MPSGLRNTSGNQFEIYYEQPWGGVASDKSYVDIEPNQLIIQSGVAINSGKLEYFQMMADPLNFKLQNPRQPDSFPYVIWVQNGVLFGCDQYGYIYKYASTGVIIQVQGLKALDAPGPTPVVASDGPWNVGGDGNIPTAVQVINGIAYIANYERHSTYTYDGNITFNLVSNYVGGKIMGVLDDYLIQFNTNNVVDGPQPNRVNWSGPGKFSTWDPAIDRTAGFNTLASVEDQLIGFYSYASVGVAVTQKGLVELSPTGIAIGPFNFTTLWTSELGQGSIFQKSVVQYGQVGYLVTDSGVYSVSTGGGFKEITGAAKQAIFNSIQIANPEKSTSITDPPAIAGCVLLYFRNNANPTPYYVFCATHRPVGATTDIITFWLMNLATGTWQTVSYNSPVLVNSQYGTTYDPNIDGEVQFVDAQTFDWVVPIGLGPGFISGNHPTTIVSLKILISGVSYAVQLTPAIFNVNAALSAYTSFTAGAINLKFRGEEIKIERQPTIRRVVIRAYGSGTLAISVNGTSFGNIVLDGTTTSKVYVCPIGVLTDQAPQLSITSTNFKAVIEKVMMAGTYADGDID